MMEPCSRAIFFPILVALAIPMSLALVAEADSAYRIRIASGARAAKPR